MAGAVAAEEVSGGVAVGVWTVGANGRKPGDGGLFFDAVAWWCYLINIKACMHEVFVSVIFHFIIVRWFQKIPNTGHAL